MIALLGLVGWAAPVVCDPSAAARLVEEARIEPHRVPVTHPRLAPGMALADPRTEAPLREALAEVCADGGQLTIETGASWETATWSAYTLQITRSEAQGCALSQQTLSLTVGVRPGDRPIYRLGGQLPEARIPVGDCAEPPRYRQEEVLDGEGEPVRLVLVVDREGERVERSAVVVRRATAEGWTEETLLSPAPDRLLHGGSGPVVTLARPGAETWVVATGDRQLDGETCAPVAGQTVWTWVDGWQTHTGRDALTLLARAGLWRLAGQDGWLLLLAQDDEGDRPLLQSRLKRLKRRQPDIELLLLESSDFPELNPGYLVVTPPPFPSRGEAVAMERAWGRRATTYVKRAWSAQDGCAPGGAAPGPP